MLLRIWNIIGRLIRWLMALIIVSLIVFAFYDHLTDPDRQVFSFDRIDYDVTLESDGSARVVETRSYTFERGRFTFGWFNLAAEATDIQVSEDGRAYLRLDSQPDRRVPNQYVVLPADEGHRVEWYYEARGPETRHFQISYRVPDVAIRHTDAVVYFQKYFTTADTADVRRIEVAVRLPQGADAGNTLIWGHGPAQGQINFDPDDDNLVLLEVKDVGENQYVEARFLLPEDSVPGARRENTAVYDQVLAEENEAARDADRVRLLLRVATLLAVLVLLALLVLLIRYYRLHRSLYQRLRAEPVAPYLRDVPAQIPLPIAARLFRFYKRNPAQPELISLTILDLIRRGILLLESEPNGSKQELFLRLRPSEGGSFNVHGYEAPLLDFLFRDAAAGAHRLGLSQLKRFSRAYKNRSASTSLLLGFDKALEKAWNQSGYPDLKREETPAPLRHHRLACLAAAGLAFLILFFVDAAISALPGALLMGGSVFLLLLNLFLTRKRPFLTQLGENERARWQALARFFQDFSAFDEKDLPEIGLWEDLLIYAAALSMADQVLKQLQMRYPDLDNWTWRNQNYYYLYGNAFTSNRFMSQTTGLSGLQSSLNQIMQSAHSVVRSQSSSSGGGGGFSGGGSSGGGGGGGSSGGGVG